MQRSEQQFTTIRVPARHAAEFQRIVDLLSEPGNLARFRELVKAMAAEQRESFLERLAGPRR